MKDLVLKVLRMRKTMLHKGVCGKDSHRIECAIQVFNKYAEFYPNASDKGYRSYVKKHFEDFMILMPGRSHSAFRKMHTELSNHLYK